MNSCDTPEPIALLVTDVPAHVQHLDGLLTVNGFRLRTATSAAEALRSLESRFASLVIVDRATQGLDALALCRAIRGREWPGYVYLMLLTAHDSEGDVAAGLRSGADDYVHPRVSSSQLFVRLHTARRILGLEMALDIAVQWPRPGTAVCPQALHRA
jgi:DNA-binding response OmpR family regulator